MQGRLLGYRAAWFTLEHLDEHFHALREEYGEQHGCKLSADTLPSLAGGSPGLLPQLCTSVEAVRQWLVSLLGSINDAAARARRLLGGEDEAYRDPPQGVRRRRVDYLRVARSTLSWSPG